MGSVQGAVVLALGGVRPFELGIPGRVRTVAREKGAGTAFCAVGARGIPVFVAARQMYFPDARGVWGLVRAWRK